jgi:hypothetical protein
VYEIDGSPGFAISYDAVGARALETSEPAIDQAGVVRALVYEHDVELSVVAASVDGKLLHRTSLGSGYPIRAGDLSPKLGTCIAACDDGGFIASWEYRQVREYFVAKYRDGESVPEWTASEWMVAATRDAVLGYTAPGERHDWRTVPGGWRTDPDRSMLVCRDKRDGSVMWKRPGGFIDVGGATEDAFLLVDRTSRMVEARNREAEIEQAFLAGAIAESGLGAMLDIWPFSPTTVLLVDALTGNQRSSLAIADEVFAAHVSVSVMSSAPTGDGQLVTNGIAIAIHGRVSTFWPPSFLDRLPLIVGHVDDLPLWADVDGIHGAASLVLPASIGGFHRRLHDRSLAKANAVIAAGHIYLRCGDALWISELP